MKVLQKIVIVSYEYPFAWSDPFLRNEISVLSEYFQCKEISILEQDPEAGSGPEQRYALIRYKISFRSRVMALRHLFSSFVWEELFFILQDPGIRKSIALKEMIHALVHADSMARATKRFFSGKGKATPAYYTYWTDERTLAGLLLKSKIKEMKVITRVHGWDLYFYRQRGNYLPFRRFIARKADLLGFISEDGHRYLSSRLRLKPGDNWMVSRLGVGKASAEFIPGKPETFRLLSCSSLIPLKRIHLIIEALALLQEVNLIWHHYGGGELMEAISLLAKEKLSKHSNIQWHLKGQLSNDDVLKEFATGGYTVLINTSETEGVPVTMMEAMAAGIPVIGTNVGGVKEILEDGMNGILLPPDSGAQQISEAIRVFTIMDQENYIRFQSNAYKTWKTKFNRETNYRRFAENLMNLWQSDTAPAVDPHRD